MKNLAIVCILLAACATEQATEEDLQEVAVSESALTVLGYPLPAACRGGLFYSGEYGTINQSITDPTIDGNYAQRSVRTGSDVLALTFIGADTGGFSQSHARLIVDHYSHICVLADMQLSTPCYTADRVNNGVITTLNKRWYAPGDGNTIQNGCVPGRSPGASTASIRVYGEYGI